MQCAMIANRNCKRETIGRGVIRIDVNGRVGIHRGRDCLENDENLERRSGLECCLE